MADLGLTVQQREILWSSVAVVGFVVTGWVYINFGFIQGFPPLLISIFSIRRLLALAMREENNLDLTERYEVVPDREYTTDEQIAILSEVETEYSHKRRIWGTLGVISSFIGIVAGTLSLVLALVCFGIASYCLIRYVRLRRLLRMIESRTNELSRQ